VIQKANINNSINNDFRFVIAVFMIRILQETRKKQSHKDHKTEQKSTEIHEILMLPDYLYPQTSYSQNSILVLPAALGPPVAVFGFVSLYVP
jgi:hypothetical protein